MTKAIIKHEIDIDRIEFVNPFFSNRIRLSSMTDDRYDMTLRVLFVECFQARQHFDVDNRLDDVLSMFLVVSNVTYERLLWYRVDRKSST
jgi:hypothetical protein